MQLCRRQTKTQGDGRTGNGILNTGLIDKGNTECVLLTFEDVTDQRHILITLAFPHLLHKHRRLLITPGPGDFFALILHTTDATAHDIIVGTIDHRLCVMHQFQFLHAFLLHRTEVLLMGRSKTGQYADGRLDDVTQGKHLTRLTDTCLEDTHLCLFVEQPHGKGHTDLGVVTAGGAYNLL